MNKNNNVELSDGKKKEINDLRERIESKLIMRGIADPKEALECQQAHKVLYLLQSHE